MSGTEQPAWLAAALSSRERPPTARSVSDIRPRQIRALNPMDPGSEPSRLVLITSVDTELAVAQVMLLSAEIEMASDLERSLPTQATGLNYELVALSDVISPAWFVQLGPTVSVLVEEVETHSAAGITLRDNQDARWTWKEEEHDRLVALTAECRFQLLDGEPAWVADPAAFDLNRVDWAERTCMSAAILPMLHTNNVLVPTEVFKGAPIPSSSKAYESDNALRHLIGRHKDRLLATGDLTTTPLDLRSMKDDSLPAAIAAAAMLDRSVRSIHVLSVGSLWVGDGGGDTHTPRIREVIFDGRRLQIVISEVDWDEVPCG